MIYVVLISILILIADAFRHYAVEKNVGLTTLSQYNYRNELFSVLYLAHATFAIFVLGFAYGEPPFDLNYLNYPDYDFTGQRLRIMLWYVSMNHPLLLTTSLVILLSSLITVASKIEFVVCKSRGKSYLNRIPKRLPLYVSTLVVYLMVIVVGVYFMMTGETSSTFNIYLSYDRDALFALVRSMQGL